MSVNNIREITPADEEWPLHEWDWPAGEMPQQLWVRGAFRIDTLCAQSVAVVGSRASTAYGNGVASDMAADLAGAGFTVVSGAAFGIDTAAHRAALASVGTRSTVAVLGCGVDVAYPAANATLLDGIAHFGAVVSAYGPGTFPNRERFLERNRLIAALSQGMVVVEASMRSGARAAANRATDLGRPVFAVPGPVHSAASAGTHEMIRSGQAELVTGARDVLARLNNNDNKGV